LTFRDLVRRTFSENDQFGCSLLMLIAVVCALIGIVAYVIYGLFQLRNMHGSF